MYELLTYEGHNYSYNALLFYVTFEPDKSPYRLWPDPKHEHIVIGGKNGEVFSSNSVSKHDGEKFYRRIITISLKENNNQTLSIQIAYSDLGKNAITIDEFDQILSTFKFTNQH